MAFGFVMEALARIEHKLDLILKAIKYNELPDRVPMSFLGHQCPICDQMVQYTVDLTHNVVVRKCQCSTGKLAPTIPLFPAALGDVNGNPTADGPGRSEGEGTASNRRRR